METLQKLHKSFIDQIYKEDKILTYRSNTAKTKEKMYMACAYLRSFLGMNLW